MFKGDQGSVDTKGDHRKTIVKRNEARIETQGTRTKRSGASFEHGLNPEIGGGIRDRHKDQDSVYDAHRVSGLRIRRAGNRGGV